MAIEPRPRIALLIDADNAPARAISLVLNDLSTVGETNLRRAYANWTKLGLTSWQAVLHENAIRPVQQYDVSKGKNASDMALAVDAVALLYTDQPDAFAIMSSDADFTPLVMHLREKGAAVYGYGEQKAPEPFVTACSRFLFLDQVEAPAAPGTAAASTSPREPAAPRTMRSTPELRQDTRLVNLLRGAVDSAAAEDGWAMVATVGQRISNQSSFDARNYGYGSLTKLLVATQLFAFKKVGQHQAVRDARRKD